MDECIQVCFQASIYWKELTINLRTFVPPEGRPSAQFGAGSWTPKAMRAARGTILVDEMGSVRSALLNHADVAMLQSIYYHDRLLRSWRQQSKQYLPKHQLTRSAASKGADLA